MVTQNTLRTCEGAQAILNITFKFATAVHLKKCPKQITCAPIPELPSNISAIQLPFGRSEATVVLIQIIQSLKEIRLTALQRKML